MPPTFAADEPGQHGGESGRSAAAAALCGHNGEALDDLVGGRAARFGRRHEPSARRPTLDLRRRGRARGARADARPVARVGVAQIRHELAEAQPAGDMLGDTDPFVLGGYPRDLQRSDAPGVQFASTVAGSLIASFVSQQARLMS